MLEDLLEKPSSYLLSHSTDELDAALFERFRNKVKRRLTGEPLAYVLGHCGFWSLDLNVSPTTLIPRPETELLVELAIQAYPNQTNINALDLGTGTGAIALAIASECSLWKITATDQSEKIIEVAQSNAQLNCINNVRFGVGSWYQALQGVEAHSKQGSQADDKFDLIVSNPPYIEPGDHHLNQGDVRFEPHSALVAQQNGLADLRHIIDHGQQYLKPAGALMVEHGYQQGGAVRTLFTAAGFRGVISHKDLAGHPRVTVGYLA
ncbi:MAG: peptide chain release factor N(5)-glutamine methyltransferase [Pseudomonadales bacterium]|nr:peptide chain release factor N(5)-glutamine methyltransferase [Pseudomonadales bacterium]